MPKISTIILSYKGIDDTLECLNSVKLQTGNFQKEIIVVDNASNDQSSEIIKRNYPDIKLIVNTENLGYAQGNNVGIQTALSRGADYIFILNNDTKLAPDCLQNLLNFAENTKTAGILSPKIYFYPGTETHSQRYKPSDSGKIIWYAGGKIDWKNMLASHRGVDDLDTGQFNHPQKTSFISGCAMFVRREVFETVGTFDNKLFLYYEDVDLCLRTKRKKYEIWYVPQAVIWHKNAHASGGTGSDLQVYYQTRNRLIIGMRYASVRTKFALFKEAASMIFSGKEIQKQAVKDYLTNKYGKTK